MWAGENGCGEGEEGQSGRWLRLLSGVCVDIAAWLGARENWTDPHAARTGQFRPLPFTEFFTLSLHTEPPLFDTPTQEHAWRMLEGMRLSDQVSPEGTLLCHVRGYVRCGQAASSLTCTRQVQCLEMLHT
jgi:hypothetical protein